MLHRFFHRTCQLQSSCEWLLTAYSACQRVRAAHRALWDRAGSTLRRSPAERPAVRTAGERDCAGRIGAQDGGALAGGSLVIGGTVGGIGCGKRGARRGGDGRGADDNQARVGKREHLAEWPAEIDGRVGRQRELDDVGGQRPRRTTA